MAKVKKVTYSVRVPLGMLIAVKKQCKDTNCFVTDFMQTAIEKEYVYRRNRRDEFSNHITDTIRKVVNDD